jgi:type IV secretion system protein VirD4
VSTNVEEIERPLMTPDECGRLPGPRKDTGGNITQAGDMLIFATGFPPIYGKQILYFNDPVFSGRAKIPAPTGSATPFVQKRATAKATRPEGEGAAPSIERELAHELVEKTDDLIDYPQAEPDVAAEDEEAIMRYRQEHIATPDEDAPPDELTDYEDEPEDEAIGSRRLRKDAETKPPHPAVPYVKRAPRDTNAIEEVINPDMRPVEPAKVKPPRRAHV